MITYFSHSPQATLRNFVFTENYFCNLKLLYLYDQNCITALNICNLVLRPTVTFYDFVSKYKLLILIKLLKYILNN